MREAIVELAERVGIAALKRVHGRLSDSEAAQFREHLKARLDREETKYPIYESLETAIPDVLELGKLAEIATSKSIRQRERNISESFGTPLSDMWQTVVQEEASLAAEEHWKKAGKLFREEQTTEAARELTRAVVCTVAATAAAQGWPHAGDEQMHDAITALATGKMPTKPSDTYELVLHAPDKGADLTSAFGACMGFPDTLMYDPMDRTPQEAEADARYYAQLAIDLIKELSGRKW